MTTQPMTITLDGMRWFHQAANERIAKAEAAKQAVLALPKGSRGKTAKLAEAEAKLREEVGHRNEIDAVVRKAKQPLIEAKVSAVLQDVVGKADQMPLASQVIARSHVLRKEGRQRTPFALALGDGFRGVYCEVSYDQWGYPQYIELRPRATLDETVKQVERWKQQATQQSTKDEYDRILADPLDYVTYSHGISVTVGLQSSYWEERDGKHTTARYGINMSTCTESETEEWYRSYEVIQVADRLRKEMNQAGLPKQHQWYNMLHDINVDIE